MVFDHIGIHGWDNIEPLILASALSDLPMLFIGDIGANKTEGSQVIAKALLGEDIEFRSYEVPTLNFDDLIGFVNPKHLAKGTLEFVPTPLSIWNADAVLFDEINRANPFIQSKLHEVIRTRTLMGMPTNLKMVFSAVNPPERYQSGYMDMALASRFVCIPVPNITDMREKQIDCILCGNGPEPDSYDLNHIMKRARKCQIKEDEQSRVYVMAKKIIHELSNQEIIFNARQLKMMTRLIMAGLRLGYASGSNVFSEADAVTSYITSVIPEVQGIVRTNVDAGMTRGTVRNVVSGFTLGDPVTIAEGILDLCEITITDSLAWATAAKQMADMEEDADVLKQAADKIKSLNMKGVIEEELMENVLNHVKAQIIIQTLIKEDVPVTGLMKRAHQIGATI